MIINFRELTKQAKIRKFITSSNNELFLEYEKKLIHIFQKLKNNLEIININQIQNNKDDKFFTLDPEIYENLKSKLDIKLFIISVDKAASNFLSLYKYASIYPSHLKLKYKEKYFKKFLLKFSSIVKIKSWPNYILSFINLIIYKTKKNNYGIKIEKSFNTHNGMLLGHSYLNRYINPDPSIQFLKKFKFVESNLKSQRSKRIYNMVAFSKPNKIWKHKYSQFFLNNQYFDYYKLPSKSIIINIGVNDGFEIPFFLLENPNILVNIDPTGKEKLNQYVTNFITKFKHQTKLIFCEDYLYDKKFVYKNDIDSKPKKLTDIINDLKLEKINFIKSDIEGLEMELINELENIVKKYRPILAISIYHLDNSKLDINFQYVEIPYILMKFCKNYSFELNHYTYHRSETIFYCIPK